MLLSLFSGDVPVYYDDQDGHREPWAEWVESSCVDEPRIIMDSSPDCNPNTNLGVTVWKCNDGNGGNYPWSYYTTHWYCESYDIPIQGLENIYLPSLFISLKSDPPKRTTTP